MTALAAAWAGWPWTDAQATTDAALIAVPMIVTTYADIASGIAADQYDQWRDGVAARGRFRASPAQIAEEDQILAGVRNAVGPLWAATPDEEAAKTLLSGMTARHVLHGASDTIVEATWADPAAVGWGRHARPGACRFCRMLADRGAVYRKEETARFKAHDNCHCSAAPSWDPDSPKPVVEQYIASQRTQTKADRARVRAYLDEHYPL